MQIKHNSPIPLYYQLREQIRENILSGKWDYGKELPAELKLCEELNLSRATVKQAMDGLVQEGLIERKKGKGTFVIYRQMGGNFFSQPSFTRQMGELGLDLYSRILSTSEGPLEKSLEGYFDPADGDNFCKLHRVRYVRNKPIVIEENYIRRRWAKDLLRQPLNTLSVYSYLETANGIKFDNHHYSIRAVPLRDEEKQALGLEDDRVQLIVFKKDLVGICLDILSYCNGERIMLTRRIFEGSHFSITVDYNATTRQLSVENGKWTIPL